MALTGACGYGGGMQEPLPPKGWYNDSAARSFSSWRWASYCQKQVSDRSSKQKPTYHILQYYHHDVPFGRNNIIHESACIIPKTSGVLIWICFTHLVQQTKLKSNSNYRQTQFLHKFEWPGVVLLHPMGALGRHLGLFGRWREEAKRRRDFHQRRAKMTPCPTKGTRASTRRMTAQRLRRSSDAEEEVESEREGLRQMQWTKPGGTQAGASLWIDVDVRRLESLYKSRFNHRRKGIARHHGPQQSGPWSIQTQILIRTPPQNTCWEEPYELWVYSRWMDEIEDLQERSLPLTIIESHMTYAPKHLWAESNKTRRYHKTRYNRE